MANKQRIRFIANPFAGVDSKKEFPLLIEELMDLQRFDYDIHFTEAAGHGGDLAREAVTEGYHAVVIMGGDGSINEVARELIGSPVKLGIIPGGSGNGIARSLGIPLNSRKAIALINEFNADCIDTGLLDDRPFIGIAGIGFDAHIGDRFLTRKIRGKLAYGYVMLKEFGRFKSFDLHVEGQNLPESAFLVAFANTAQYGNNAVIAPLAEYQDGKLELVAIKEVHARHIPELMLRMFNKSIHHSTLVHQTSFEKISLKHSGKIGHVDGEPFPLSPETQVSIAPKSLWVIL